MDRQLTEDAMPGQRHPYYSWVDVESVFAVAKKAGGKVILPKMRYVKAIPEPDEPYDAAFETIIMTRYMATGPVPSVGVPAYYTWYYLRDDLGRCIGEPAGRQKRRVSRAAQEAAYNQAIAMRDLAQDMYTNAILLLSHQRIDLAEPLRARAADTMKAAHRILDLLQQVLEDE